NYLETGKWYQNVDDPLSLAVAPMLSYGPNGPSSVEQPQTDKQVLSHTYYNLAGMASSKPFDGVNIMVTRYTDGTQTATKVLR
ncbi:MAG: hypothetical protein II603_04785, partial [Muribaculaceae bacterium]|nr:hypothetical protein [Muribaculaceae bacterium]